MEKHTHRQYLGWMAYLDNQWNNPDRNDWYLMQVAAEVRRGNLKHPEKLQIGDLKIPFKEKVIIPETPPTSPEEKVVNDDRPKLVTKEMIVNFNKQKLLQQMTMPVTTVISETNLE